MEDRSEAGGWGSSWHRMLLVVGLAAVLLIAGTVAAAARVHGSADKILAGVTIDGVDVSGLTRDQAIQRISAHVAPRLSRKVSISAAERHWTRTAASLGRSVDVAGAVDRAMAGPELAWASSIFHRVTNQKVRLAVPLVWRTDRAKPAAFVRSLAPQLARPASDAWIRLQHGQVTIHHARQGRALDVATGTKLLTAAVTGGRSRVSLPVRPVRPAVADNQVGRTITIDRGSNVLRLWRNLSVWKTYQVATAKTGFVTPAGTWKVEWKEVNPTWHNPAPHGWGAGEPLVIPPGPGNPLGTRALHLNAPGIIIHGTYADGSVGTYASHGCIRMHIPESEALYPLVPVGTPVLIYG